MKEFFKTKSPYEKKEKSYKQEGLLSSENTSLLNSKIPSFFDTKEKSTQKTPSFLSNDDAEAVEQGKRLAEEAIDGNLRRGTIDSTFLQSHPNLYNGLSMFYAHSLSKNKNPKAANQAYKYAYEEAASNSENLDSNLQKNSAHRYTYDKYTINSYDGSEILPQTAPYSSSYRDKQNHDVKTPQAIYEYNLQRIQQIRKREIAEKRKPLKVTHQTQQVFGNNNPGCLLTCISMVYSYYGYETTPEQLYELNGNSYYVNFNNIQNNSKLNEKLAFTMSEKDTSENEVYKKCLEELQKGNPVIVEVKYSGGTHSVLVYGYTGDWDKKSDFDGSEFLVMDPYRETEKKSDTAGLNTMQHTVDMFRTRAPKIHRWFVYKPVKEK